MRMLKKAAIGAADLSLDRLITAIEHVLADARYSLEWVPGAITDKYFGTKLYLQWMASPEQGSWLVLPVEPHGSRIAAALVRELQRPLVYHVAHWYSEGRRGEVGVATYEMQAGGQKSPRPTGLESRDLDEITEGGPEDRLQQLIGLLTGIRDTPESAQYSFPIYEVADGADEDGATDSSKQVSEERLNEILDLLRRPASRAMLRREGPNSHLAVIEGAEKWGINIYMNSQTAAALVSDARREALPLLEKPSIKGVKQGFE